MLVVFSCCYQPGSTLAICMWFEDSITQKFVGLTFVDCNLVEGDSKDLHIYADPRDLLILASEKLGRVCCAS